MKFHPVMLALLASPLAASAGDLPAKAPNKPTSVSNEPAKIIDGCENMLRVAAAAFDADWLPVDDDSGDITLDKADLAAVKVSDVRVISSSCIGPGDCDAQHPDAFTWGATVNGAKVTVSYHRGHCTVGKFIRK